MSDEVIDCGEILTIANVGDIYGQLLALLAEGKFAVLDCSKIERIDTAALQVLAAYAQEAEIQSVSLNWQDPSDTFVKNASVLGLASKLYLEQN
ncbi:MAG: STAS domain-containing protein [Gammaproteobacteria bacterium]|nr:STAS domain-containing protein [Gammaproteobacteria bacterium]